MFTDEITQDFDRACLVAQEMGVPFVELRTMWDKNIVDLDKDELEETRRILKRRSLGVTSIAGPLFKVDWPGAPRSQHSPKRDQFGAEHTIDEQEKILEKEIELAGMFETSLIRCFDFWRLDNPEHYRAAMDEKLNAAAEKAGRRGLTLVMENEHACNTSTAHDALRTLAAVKSPHFKLNWDPGNAFFAGETPYPDEYRLLPVERIGHVHCKDAKKRQDGSCDWMAMGEGEVDFVGQFRALLEDGYAGPLALETHWRGGSAEESTRISMAGMLQQLRDAGALG